MSSPHVSRTRRRLLAPAGAVRSTVVVVFATLVGCLLGPFDDAAVNPFRDLPAIELDGEPQEMPYTIAPLGVLDRDQVLRLKMEGQAIEAVLILAEDDEFEEAGVLAGGGPSNTFFDYRVQMTGRYFVFVLFRSGAAASEQRATLTAMVGDPNFTPPQTQAVLVVFEENYLTDPGLIDPESFTDEERRTLEEISPSVRAGVMDRLRAVFADTPIEILEEGDSLPDAPVSRLTFRAQRETADEDTVYFDTAIPPLDEEHAQCGDRVVFGEVLPRATLVDVGNHVLDDEAVVYVGSFQGRGEACRSAAITSGNNIILGLAHTAAHEIGHLVGLYHVPLPDVMNRSPTLAFQRELSLGRGQFQVETPTGSEILTTILQDPDFYFRAAFSN